MCPVLSTIDHIFLRAGNAGDIYNELVDNAGLPVAWPFRAMNESLSSGAVSFGNLILELVQTSDALAKNNTNTNTDTDDAPSEKPTDAPGFVIPEYGIALAPHATIAESRACAATRGIELDADDSFYGEDGTMLWTRALVPELSGDGMDTFFCEYGADQWPMRAGSRDKLKASRGGALGIEGVEAMTVRSARWAETTSKWQLMAVDGADQGMPRVEVVEGEGEGLHGLRVKVRDAAMAEKRFRELLPHFPDTLKLSFV